MDLLVLLAVICFFLAVLLPLINVSPGRVQLVALGLFLWALSVLIN